MVMEKMDPERPITVLINSPGGSADSGFAIYDILRFVRPPVYTVVNGLCASAAMAGLIPIGDALGMAAARAWRFDYAPARAVGSAAFLGANLLMGWAIGAAGAGVALWTLAACLAAAAIAGLRHPGGGRVAGGSGVCCLELRLRPAGDPPVR